MVSLLPSSKITGNNLNAIIRGHRFNEAEVLRHVHLAHSEDVIRSDGTPVCPNNRSSRKLVSADGKEYRDEYRSS